MSSAVFPEIRVSLDIGCRLHSVVVGLADGKFLDEFEIEHTKAGFESFFNKISRHEAQHKLPVSVKCLWSGLVICFSVVANNPANPGIV